MLILISLLIYLNEIEYRQDWPLVSKNINMTHSEYELFLATLTCDCPTCYSSKCIFLVFISYLLLCGTLIITAECDMWITGFVGYLTWSV